MRFSSYLLFFLSFLPYNFVYIANQDIQPVSFYLTLYILITYLAFFNFIVPKKYVKNTLYVFTLLLLHIILILTLRHERVILNDIDLLTGIRMLGGLMSLFLIPFVVVLLPEIKLKLVLYIMILVWLAFALIQSYVDIDFGRDLVASSRYGLGGRGVGSLAPEPDSYGRMVLCFLVLSYLLFLEKKITFKPFLIIIVLSLFQVIFLSKAATSAVLILIVTYLILISLKSKKYILLTTILTFLIFSIIIYVGMNYFSGYRFFNILIQIIENPNYLFSQGGFMTRFFNLILSFYIGIIDTGGIGSGLIYPRSEFNLNIISSYHDTFVSTTAHGGAVGLVYTFGLIGLIFVIVFYKLLINAIKKLTKDYNITFYCLLMIFTVLFLFDLSLSDPSRLFVLGYLFKNLKRDRIKKNEI